MSELSTERLDESLLARCLKPRRRDAHKGDFGRVLIVGGGLGMPGAVRLCGEACLRGGAGLATVATRSANVTAVVSGRPELICHGIEDAARLGALLSAADVVVVGPGLGRDDWARSVLDCVLDSGRPLVVDADALNLLAAEQGSRRQGSWILTPHPGEAARLLGSDTAAVQHDRMGALHRLVGRYGGIVVLKGAGTLIGCEGRTPALCDRGNPGMATAGMGDVLSGAIAAMLVQIGDPWDAVRVAVLAHALAGDASARVAGERGLIASDVIAQLPACLNPRH